MDMVSGKYVYEDVTYNIMPKTLYVFECLLDAVAPNGSGKEFEVNSPYFAKQLSEFVGGKIPAAILTALVKRGMLQCQGKVDGKNVYSITEEIYEYYISCYRPTKEAYKAEINNLGKRSRQ